MTRQERPDGFYTALDEIFRALGNEKLRLFDQEDTIDLFVLAINGMIALLTERADVGTAEDVFELLRLRFDLDDLPETRGP